LDQKRVTALPVLLLDHLGLQMKARILAATFAALVAAAPAFAADTSIGRTALSLPDSTDAQTTFKTDAPKIVLHAEILDVSKGTKVGADWIAEKTGAAPPNYKIDGSELTLNDENEVTFSLSKPDAGWPVGAYRVDLSVNGEKAKSVKFEVAE
jgi:hypothetical protein